MSKQASHRSGGRGGERSAALAPSTWAGDSAFDPASDDELTRNFYAELRRIAERVFASERAGHTLQPTAVVNEACIRLLARGEAEDGSVGAARLALPDVPREQKLALAGRVLRQVLIDHARTRDADKRGGGQRAAMNIDVDDGILNDEGEPTQIDFAAIHRALERLRQLSERQAEVVTLRMFAGLSMEQVATVMGVSKRTAEGDWTVARAWLRRELAEPLKGDRA